MVVSPLLRGLFGLEADALERRISLEPHLPADWLRFEIRNVPLSDGRTGRQGGFRVSTRRSGSHPAHNESWPDPFQLTFAPAFAPVTELTGADFNGASVNCPREDNGADWHARCVVTRVPARATYIALPQFVRLRDRRAAAPLGRAQFGGEAGFGGLGRPEPVAPGSFRKTWTTSASTCSAPCGWPLSRALSSLPEVASFSFQIPGQGSAPSIIRSFSTSARSDLCGSRTTRL